MGRGSRRRIERGDWVPIALGVVGGGLTFGLVWDLIRGRHRG